MILEPAAPAQWACFLTGSRVAFESHVFVARFSLTIRHMETSTGGGCPLKSEVTGIIERWSPPMLCHEKEGPPVLPHPEDRQTDRQTDGQTVRQTDRS